MRKNKHVRYERKLLGGQDIVWTIAGGLLFVVAIFVISIIGLFIE